MLKSVLTIGGDRVGLGGSRARRLRHSFRSRLAEHPALYLPLARFIRKRPGPAVVGADTELVIDGYPRSANTFAVFAFQLAQTRPVRLAHHLHAPAHLIEAARLRAPALALIREPEGAVLSTVIREPDVGLKAALASYSRFYLRLMPHRSRLAVATFEEVTGDFGEVIELVNRKFGTSFARFEHTPENVLECFRLIEERTRRPRWGTLLAGFTSGFVTSVELREFLSCRGDWRPLTDSLERLAPRPSEHRARLRESLQEEFNHPRLEAERIKAYQVYDAFVGSQAPTS